MEATSEPGSEEASEDIPPRKGRKVSEKQIKLAVVVVVVVVIVAVLLWGMVPERIYEVKEVHDEIGEITGTRVNVKGVVMVWEVGRSNFTLSDTNNENLTIEVTHSGAFPEGFGFNATIVAKGTVQKDGTIITMGSDEIQIGCPSKY